MAFLYGNWLRLPISTRHAIAQAFHIHKKNPTHVVNNYVQDDGYPVGDVESALSVDAIQKFVGSDETNADVLWEMCMAKVENRPAVISEIQVTPTPTPVIVPPVEVILTAPKKGRGRPRKVV